MIAPRRGVWLAIGQMNTSWEYVYLSHNDSMFALARRRQNGAEFSVQADVEADFGFRPTLTQAQDDAAAIIHRLGGNCEHERHPTRRLPPYMKLVCSNCLLELPDTEGDRLRALAESGLEIQLTGAT